jgi:hypothetical protein
MLNIIINAQNLTTENMVTKQISLNESNTTTKENIIQKRMPSLLCEKRDKPYFLPHKTEISQFYVCVKGQLFLLNCPSGYRFDSEADQCVRRMMKDEIQESKFIPFEMIFNREFQLELRQPYLIPHETNCGWFYVVRIETTGERVLNSCPMPQLFDIPTLECKNYTEVKCKHRFEPKDACKYSFVNSQFHFSSHR